MHLLRVGPVAQPRNESCTGQLVFSCKATCASLDSELYFFGTEPLNTAEVSPPIFPLDTIVCVIPTLEKNKLEMNTSGLGEQNTTVSNTYPYL